MDTATLSNLASKQLTNLQLHRATFYRGQPSAFAGGGAAAGSVFSLVSVIGAFQDPPIQEQEGKVGSVPRE